LVELNSLDVTHAQWVAKVKALKDLLTHHLKRRKSFCGGKFFDEGQKSLQFSICRKRRDFKRKFLLEETPLEAELQN